jgi:hypothetical protein
MPKRTWFLIVLAAVLGGLYVYHFTDWINVPRIQILKSSRMVRNPRFAQATYPVVFTLDGRYQLTSVKVYAASALATNKRTSPLWHLVTKSNTPPLRGFFYGQRIPGMVPYKTNSPPQRLQPGVTYRLLLEAGRARGQLDFTAQSAGGEE